MPFNNQTEVVDETLVIIEVCNNRAPANSPATVCLDGVICTSAATMSKKDLTLAARFYK
jgi:hypothetical protein